MTSILIKSYNRIYYLDRCIQSIIKNVNGHYKIIVLDDQTSNLYINNLKLKYSFIEIIISNSKNLTDSSSAFRIPTHMWVNAVKNASDYFIIVEDDVWFTQPIDLDDVVETAKHNGIKLLKLGWNSNKSLDRYVVKREINCLVESTTPKDLFIPKFFLKEFFYNKYKLFSILYHLKIVNNDTKRKYWLLNSILMGLWEKDYWLEIWKDSQGKVDEKLQIYNALNFYKRNFSDNFIARLKIENTKTTFKSSATGSYHEYGNHFDVNRMNFILNEAWLNNEFDAMENYPKDFSDDYIKTFLDKANHPDAQFSEWFKWAEKFRQQYRNLGAEVDN